MVVTYTVLLVEMVVVQERLTYVIFIQESAIQLNLSWLDQDHHLPVLEVLLHLER